MYTQITSPMCVSATSSVVMTGPIIWASAGSSAPWPGDRCSTSVEGLLRYAYIYTTLLIVLYSVVYNVIYI